MEHYFSALILGILEGLTEFLPVSSTGHLILMGYLLKFEGEVAKTFEVFIQLGSILAIAILYRQRFFSFFRKNTDPTKPKLNMIHIILGCVPALAVGFLMHDIIKTYLFSPYVVVVGLVLGGILMIYAEKKGVNHTANTLDELSYKQAFVIGLFQCLAAICPGFSRSGSTISGGLLGGANYKTAAEFSFLIAVPMMVAASGYDLLKTYKYITVDDIELFAIGFIAAFLVASLAVVTFLKVLQRFKLIPFAYYRFILAGVFCIYLLM